MISNHFTLYLYFIPNMPKKIELKMAPYRQGQGLLFLYLQNVLNLLRWTFNGLVRGKWRKKSVKPGLRPGWRQKLTFAHSFCEETNWCWKIPGNMNLTNYSQFVKSSETLFCWKLRKTRKIICPRKNVGNIVDDANFLTKRITPVVMRDPIWSNLHREFLLSNKKSSVQL